MKRQEAEAKGRWFRHGLARVRQRNLVLDNLMWMRNAPKLHMSNLLGNHDDIPHKFHCRKNPENPYIANKNIFVILTIWIIPVILKPLMSFVDLTILVAMIFGMKPDNSNRCHPSGGASG
jgi:hypothetical protein